MALPSIGCHIRSLEDVGPFEIYDIYSVKNTDLALLDESKIKLQYGGYYACMFLDIQHCSDKLNRRYFADYKLYAKNHGKLASLDVWNELVSLVPSKITGDQTINLFFDFHLEKMLKNTLRKYSDIVKCHVKVNNILFTNDMMMRCDVFYILTILKESDYMVTREELDCILHPFILKRER